jgi:carbonic anhydrase
LLEFHFHSPAEHLIDGNLTDMEVHFVFKKDGQDNCGSGLLVVLGKRIVAGTPTPPVNEQINKIFGPNVNLPVNYSSPATEVSGFVISRLLEGIGREFLYSGSLTAPANLANCGNPPGNPDQQLESGYLPEVVSWVLFEQPLILSAAQIARFQQLFPNGDSRAPQPLRNQNPKRTFSR